MEYKNKRQKRYLLRIIQSLEADYIFLNRKSYLTSSVLANIEELAESYE